MGVVRADHLGQGWGSRRPQAWWLSGRPREPRPTSKQYFSPRMELWTGLTTVLESALRSRLPRALMGMETDSREPWCLEEHQKGPFLAPVNLQGAFAWRPKAVAEVATSASVFSSSQNAGVFIGGFFCSSECKRSENQPQTENVCCGGD